MCGLKPRNSAGWVGVWPNSSRKQTQLDRIPMKKPTGNRLGRLLVGLDGISFLESVENVPFIRRSPPRRCCRMIRPR